jgi:hypothetical protein
MVRVFASAYYAFHSLLSLAAAGPLLFSAVNGTTQHKSDCVARILRHFEFKISAPGEFPFFAVEKDNICAAIIKAFTDS